MSLGATTGIRKGILVADAAARLRRYGFTVTQLERGTMIAAKGRSHYGFPVKRLPTGYCHNEEAINTAITRERGQ